MLRHLSKLTALLPLVLLLFSSSPARACKVLASTVSPGWSQGDATQCLYNAMTYPCDTIVVDLQSDAWEIDPLEFISEAKLKNKVILFQPGVAVKARSGFALGESLFSFVDCDSFKLSGYGSVFSMRKADYSSGGSRHAISLRMCERVSLEGLELRESGGDGIYIGPGTGNASHKFCEDIEIRDCLMEDNKRNGLSIVSAKRVQVEDCRVNLSNGFSPASGVDFLPETTQQVLEDIVFLRCQFTNNDGPGISVRTRELDGTSADISLSFEDCYLSHNNLSNNPPKTEVEISDTADVPVEGSILMNRCLIENSDWKALRIEKGSNAYSFEMRESVIKDVVQANGSYQHPIYFERDWTPTVGGATFRNVLIVYSRNTDFLHVQSTGLTDVSGSFVVANPNNPGYNAGGSSSSVFISQNSQYPLPPAKVIAANYLYSLQEGWSFYNLVPFERKKAQDWPLAVKYKMTNTAKEGLDYSFTPGFQIIETGQVEYDGYFAAVRDNVVDPGEQATFTLLADPCYNTPANGALDIATLDIQDQAPYCKNKESASVLTQSLEPIGQSSLGPNPFSTVIQIEVPSLKAYTIKMTDCRGKTVETPVSLQGNTFHLQTSSLPSGLYFVQVFHPQGVETYKVIKQ